FAFRAVSDAPKQARVVPGPLAEDGQTPRAGLELPGDDLNQGAFARSVGTDQAGQAAIDLEADVIQAHDNSVPAAEFGGLNDRVHSGFTFRLRTVPANRIMAARPVSAPASAGESRAAIVWRGMFLNISPNNGMFC